MTSMLQSVGTRVGWRSHRILEDFDENESPLPDKFRKIPSSSSLNTVRMSLRKRMPLKPVEVNIMENPTWESLEFKEKQRPLQTMRRTAKNAIGNMSQKLQKTCQNQNKYLVAPTDKVKASGRRSAPVAEQSASPRTPRRRSSRQTVATTPNSVPRFSPVSGKRVSPPSGSTKKSKKSERKEWKSLSNWVGKEGLSLRRSVRAAALKSPYSTPTRDSRRRQFDRDLESVSTGIRQLRRLSQVFDEVIVRNESDMTVCLIPN